MATKEKTRTIQDVLDSSGEQRDLMDLIVGAAVTNQDLSGDPEIISQYDALSIEQKEIINFIVGAKISELADLKHKMDVEEILSHFGVKGQKWGVRRSDRGSGNYSSAGLKSAGRRVTNGVLGDKTFWKRTAAIAGVSGVGVAASLALPAVMPASVVVAAGEIGASALGLSYSAVGGVMANPLTTGSLATAFTTTSAFGATVISAMGITGTALAGTAAMATNYANNIGRAVVGSHRAGTTRVNKTLDKKMKHSDLTTVTMTEAEDYISHFGIKGQKWGVRRSDAQLGKGKSSTTSDDAARAQATLKTIKSSKSLSSVSDADLNHLVNRMSLEQRYSNVAASGGKHPLATTHKGIKAIIGVGKTMNTAVDFARSPVGRLMARKLGLRQITKIADKGQLLTDIAEAKRPQNRKK